MTISRLPAIALGAAALVAVAGCGGSTSSRRSAVSAQAAFAPPTTAGPTTTVAPSSAAAGTITSASNPRLGVIVVDAHGMTLYRNTAETGGKIVCTGSCAAVWPPLLAPAGAPPASAAPGLPGAVATVDRPDGGRQITYDGLALYRFAGDKQPGDINGQGLHGVWFAVTPAGASATGGPTTTSAPAPPATTAAATPRTTAPAAPPTTAARAVTTTQPPTTAPPRTAPPTTSPPQTSPPTTAAPTPTTVCAYPPCY